eukprot:7377263-Prymnesium_polylepis.2
MLRTRPWLSNGRVSDRRAISCASSCPVTSPAATEALESASGADVRLARSYRRCIALEGDPYIAVASECWKTHNSSGARAWRRSFRLTTMIESSPSA